MKVYSFRVDGHEITRLTLEPGDYRTQSDRDRTRSAIAQEYHIPRHYIRMVEVDRKFKYDPI